MERETNSNSKKGVALAASETFYFATITILVAFLVGTFIGQVTRQIYITMFSPDLVVLPETDK